VAAEGKAEYVAGVCESELGRGDVDVSVVSGVVAAEYAIKYEVLVCGL